MPTPAEVTYTPISSADAVILYAENFVPSWAGAIAIDLLPAVLVFVLMVVQAAIRSGRDRVTVEDTLTLAELRAAMAALRDVESGMGPRGGQQAAPPAPAPTPDPADAVPMTAGASADPGEPQRGTIAALGTAHGKSAGADR